MDTYMYLGTTSDIIMYVYICMYIHVCNSLLAIIIGTYIHCTYMYMYIVKRCEV